MTWKRSQDSSRFAEVKYKHFPFHRLSKRTMGFDSTLGFAGEGPLAFGLGLLCFSNLMYGSVGEFIPVALCVSFLSSDCLRPQITAIPNPQSLDLFADLV